MTEENVGVTGHQRWLTRNNHGNASVAKQVLEFPHVLASS